MKSPRMLALLGALAIACSGCGSDREKTAEHERKLSDAEKRIANLTATVARLQQDMAALRGGDLQRTVRDIAAKEVQAGMTADIDKLVSAGIQKHLGADGEMGPKIRAAVREALDAADAGRQEDRRSMQGRFQQNMSEQMQRWESQRLDNLAKELDLNDDQKNRLRESQAALQAKAVESARRLVESRNADPEAILNGIHELQAEHFAAAKDFLTDEQYRSYTNRQGRLLGFLEGLGGRGRWDRQRGPGRQDQPREPPTQPPPMAPPPAQEALQGGH